MAIFIPTRISSKEDVILTVAAMICDAAEPENMNFDLYDVKKLDLDKMSVLFNMMMKAFPEQENEVKNAIKKNYKSTAWFGISASALNTFLFDVRKYFEENY